MNLYEEVVSELKFLGYINELYRFQGGNSFEYFDIKNNRFSYDNNDKYFYFSNSLAHHKYFTVRRLRQLVNNLILCNTSYSICTKELANIDSYNHIKRLVLNSEKINGIYSIQLVYDSAYYELIKDNYCFSNRKQHPNAVERVDRKIFGGGYGVTGEWLSLLEHLTFFSCYQRITREQILELISNMRTRGSVGSINNANFIVSNVNYQINAQIYNDFFKYDIMNDLENIVDKGLCLSTSKLYKNPSSTIKGVISGYQERREKTLRLLDTNFKHHIS